MLVCSLSLEECAVNLNSYDLLRNFHSNRLLFQNEIEARKVDAIISVVGNKTFFLKNINHTAFSIFC